jgi:Type I restriction enzyme R protein N terminus (HSDR_N)
MTDFWNAIPTVDRLRGEGNVEARLIIPLLHALGYEAHEIASKFPVVFQEGRLGRKPEPDFVCFYGPLHDRNNSLLVVEAKQPGETLPPGKAQGESYAQNLRAPLLLLTNGEFLEIWQMQISQDSERVLRIPVASLAAERGKVEGLLNKLAVRDYCKSLQFKTIVEATTDFSTYEAAELKRMAHKMPSIARTLRRSETMVQPTMLETTRALLDFPLGAIVIAPSGYGKTTLSQDLFKQGIQERWRGTLKGLPFDVPLPNLEQSPVSLVAFLQKRLSAHHPGVTDASLQTMLREVGATIFCDGFDQTTAAFQKEVTAEFVNLLRDYPRLQLFIFSRSAQAERTPAIAYIGAPVR